MFLSVSVVHPNRDEIRKSAIYEQELIGMSNAFEALKMEVLQFGLSLTPPLLEDAE